MLCTTKLTSQSKQIQLKKRASKSRKRAKRTRQTESATLFIQTPILNTVIERHIQTAEQSWVAENVEQTLLTSKAAWTRAPGTTDWDGVGLVSLEDAIGKYRLKLVKWNGK